MNNEGFHRSRRVFLRMSGVIAVTLLVGGARTPLALAQASTTNFPLKIGVVGSGRLGGSVGGRWVKAGHRACRCANARVFGGVSSAAALR